MRTGADAFVEAIVAAGTRYVFGNPGTTEQAFLEALRRHGGLDYVTCLHEAVAVGAADGYARGSGQVGVVQLHTACGLGNAVGMLANAANGGTPLVVFVGGASLAGAHAEPALGGDLVAMAAPVSRWAWEVRGADEIPAVVARAFKVATTVPAGPVVLAMPNDVVDQTCREPVGAPSWIEGQTVPRMDIVEQLAARIVRATRPVLLIGDGLDSPEAGAAVDRLAELTGAPIRAAYLTHAVLPEGCRLDAAELPLFDVGAARAELAGHDLVVAIGTDVLRTVFPQPGAPLGEVDLVHIGRDPWQLGKSQPCTAVLADERATVELLAEAIDALAPPTWRPEARRRADELAAALERRRTTERAADLTRGEDELDALAVVLGVSSRLPDRAVVVDESVSAMPLVARWVPRRPGRWFRSRGGGLGAGVAASVGMALARPQSRTVALVGDGATLYTITALWTAARRRLPITWIVLDNGGYRILEANTRLWRRQQSREADDGFVGTRLDDPRIDIARVAAGLGVEARSVASRSELDPALDGAFDGGPTLIHVTLSA